MIINTQDKDINELIESLKKSNEELTKEISERKRSEAERDALLKGVHAVIEGNDFTLSARRIFDACKDIIGASSGYVALLSQDETNNEVLFLEAGGLPCTVDPSLPMPIRGLREMAYKTGNTVYENNFAQSDWMKFIPNGHVHLQNVMFAPLKIDSKVVGVIGIANKDGGFNERDARLAAVFGEYAAIALFNTRSRELLEDNQRRLLYKEQQFHTAFEFSTIGIAITSPEKGWIDVNDEICRMLGYSKDELTNMTWIEITYPDDAAPDILLFNRVLAGEINGYKIEKRFIRKDGTIIYTSLLVNCKRDKNGKVDYFIAMLEDITERKAIEKQIAASLKEKELLLAEIHHRVKNNMAIITSLLSFQRYSLSDERLITIFKESEMRIKSMALIHERLYKTKDYANIDFREYISSLSTTLFDTYKIMKNNIHLNIDVKDVTIGIDTAVPCGLLINELLSNALKHAFPDQRRGEVYVGMARLSEDEIELIVRDNGVGLSEGFDIRHTDTIGWHLIMGLSETQLNGQVSVMSSNGLEFKVRFLESKKMDLSFARSH